MRCQAQAFLCREPFRVRPARRAAARGVESVVRVMLICLSINFGIFCIAVWISAGTSPEDRQEAPAGADRLGLGQFSTHTVGDAPDTLINAQ